MHACMYAVSFYVHPFTFIVLEQLYLVGSAVGETVGRADGSADGALLWVRVGLLLVLVHTD